MSRVYKIINKNIGMEKFEFVPREEGDPFGLKSLSYEKLSGRLKYLLAVENSRKSGGDRTPEQATVAEEIMAEKDAVNAEFERRDNERIDSMNIDELRLELKDEKRKLREAGVFPGPGWFTQ